MGTGAERTHVAMAGPRLAECGMNGAGSPTTSRPCGPTFVHRITKRARLRVAEKGAGGAAGSTPQPHTRAQINQDQRRGIEADRITQDSSTGK